MGGCSRNNNISLNVKLVLLPEELADYVILHELDRYVGSGKALASRLRKYGYNLL
ncbi:M48 family metallopeptidase [Chloroflexota bacterium]